MYTRPDDAVSIDDVLPLESESDFQARVVSLAKACGWLVYHTYDSRRSEAGFPDLIMVRDGYMLAVELKREDGKPTPEQLEWLMAMAEVTSMIVDVWRPSDWEYIERVLVNPLVDLLYRREKPWQMKSD